MRVSPGQVGQTPDGFPGTTVHMSPSRDFDEADEHDLTPSRPLPVRSIAYYLPQFHPIDNDRSWGKGFTDWTNARRRSLGTGIIINRASWAGSAFTILVSPDTFREHAQLAMRQRVAGFCIHFLSVRWSPLLGFRRTSTAGICR